MTIKDLTPSLVWGIFHEITQVPRPSKKEGKIREYLIEFAKKHNLKYKTDEAGNVAIFRPASAGCENAPRLVLQGHMDMVCEKNPNVEHDFDNDPIKTIIDGEWVHADGTTLGADNGIGMAAGLATLIDPAIVSGPVQALFTVDEETGLTGANALGEGMIEGDILLNLDSEEDGEICIGCCGGIGTTATFAYTPTPAPDYVYFKIKVSGLNGGHSGSDINAERGCANKLLARLLYNIGAKHDFALASFNGGNLRNAIARDAEAVGRAINRLLSLIRSRILEGEVRIHHIQTIVGRTCPSTIHQIDSSKLIGLRINVYGIECARERALIGCNLRPIAYQRSAGFYSPTQHRISRHISHSYRKRVLTGNRSCYSKACFLRAVVSKDDHSRSRRNGIELEVAKDKFRLNASRLLDIDKRLAQLNFLKFSEKRNLRNEKEELERHWGLLYLLFGKSMGEIEHV